MLKNTMLKPKMYTNFKIHHLLVIKKIMIEVLNHYIEL